MTKIDLMAYAKGKKAPETPVRILVQRTATGEVEILEVKLLPAGSMDTLATIVNSKEDQEFFEKLNHKPLIEAAKKQLKQ
jgi:hypothetical protein